jgi:hypothetical protein
MLDTIRAHVLALPELAKFAFVIAIMVGVPPLARRACESPRWSDCCCSALC